MGDQTIQLGVGYNYVASDTVGTGAGAGNNISNPHFLELDDSLSDSVEITFWDCALQSFSGTSYLYLDANDSPDGQSGWFDLSATTRQSLTWNPGQGVVIYNPGAPINIWLRGNPAVTTYPASAYCGCGLNSFLGCQYTNYSASYQNVIGSLPVEGSKVMIYSNGLAPFTMAVSDTFASGAWTPGVPTLGRDQAALFFVPCVTNCITINYPSNGIVLTVCTNSHVSFSVTATDSCCTNFTLTVTPTNNSIFSLGTTTVSCVVADTCGNVLSNSFTVTLLQRTMSLTCPTNKTVYAGSGWQFDPPKVTNACCATPLHALTPITNGSCPQVITQIWTITNTCGYSNICSQIVTNLCITESMHDYFSGEQDQWLWKRLEF